MSVPRFDTAAVVLGMHRSGTSALAGALELAGFAAPRTLIPSSQMNERGYWESEPIKSVNDGLFTELEMTWHSVEPIRVQAFDHRRFAPLRRAARDALNSEFVAGSRPLIKDPRICRLLGFWQPLLERSAGRIVYPIIVRNPLDVARSLASRNEFERDLGLLLWLRHYLDAEHLTRGRDREFVSYGGLIADWSGTLGRLNDSLNLGLTAAGIARLKVDSYLSADLQHHRSTDEQAFGELQTAPLVAEIYQLLAEWANGAEPSSAHYDQLDRARAELDRLSGLVGNALHESRLSKKRLTTAKARAEALAQDLAQAHRSAEMLVAIGKRVDAVEPEVKSLALGQTRIEALLGSLGAALEERRALEAALGESLDSRRAAQDDLERVVEEHSKELLDIQAQLSSAVKRADEANFELQSLRRKALDADEELKRVKRKYRATQDQLARERDAHRQTRMKVAAAEAAAEAYEQSLLGQGYRRAAGAANRARAVVRRLSGAERKRRQEKLSLITQSPLFDADWYLARNPDVATAALNPAAHYLDHGWREGRDPGPSFASSAYLKAHTDVARAGLNPLLHFIEFGLSEGREIPNRATSATPAPRPKNEFGPAAPCVSFPVDDDPPDRWRRAARLESARSDLVKVADLAIGYSSGADQRARICAAFERLATLSRYGERQDGAALQWPETGSSLLLDAGFVTERRLRTRWYGDPYPLVLRGFQHDPSQNGRLSQVAEGLLSSRLDFVDASLANPYFPILFIAAEPDGTVRAVQPLDFPSLCRGGVHYAEALALSAKRPSNGTGIDVVALGSDLAAGLLGIAAGSRPPLIGELAVDLSGADGSHPLFQPDFREWLRCVAGIASKAANAGEGARFAYLEEAVTLASPPVRAGSAGILSLASNMVPTIAILAAEAVEATPTDSEAMLPFLVSEPDQSQPALLVVPPAGTPRLSIEGADYPSPWPYLVGSGSPAVAGLAAAIRLSTGRPLSEAELLVPVADAALLPHAAKTQPITWLVSASDWPDESLVAGLEALALQTACSSVVRFIGDVSAADLAIARGLFEERVSVYGDTLDAARTVETPLVAYLGGGVILHDNRCAATLATLLAQGEVASASCVLVAAEKRGKAWNVSVADGGAIATAAKQKQPRPSQSAHFERLWRATYATAAPPADLWMTRTSDLARWAARTGHLARSDGLHVCTSFITASYAGEPHPSAPWLQLPAAIDGRFTQVETLFG